MSYTLQATRYTFMLSDVLLFAMRNGIPQNTLLLLLLLPAVAALVIFFRVVIGVEYLGLNRGIFLALGIASLGLHGLFFFLASIMADIAIRGALERRRLLPPAKYALVLFITLLILLSLFIAAAYSSKDPSNNAFLSLGILPILLIIVSAQGMLQINPGDSLWRPFGWLAEMLIFLGGGFFLLTSLAMRQFVISSPGIYVVSLLIIMIALGKYRGLRVSEFFRFVKVMSKPEP